MTIIPRVVDLSHWNTVEDMHATAAAGIWGCIHKATEGEGVVDEMYEERRALAAGALLRWGAYHFLRPGDMAEQAAFFVEIAGIDEHMLYAADYEDDRVSLDDLKAFVSMVEQLVGRPESCVIYSGHVLKEQLDGAPDAFLGKRRLWLAQYAAKPTLPPGWERAWLWQYTDQGEIAGIAPPVDLDAYDGTREALAAEWAGAGTIAPPGAPQVITVSIRITVPPGASVTIGTE